MDKKNAKKKSGNNMEVEKVKELIDLMKANDITEMEIIDGEKQIILKRGGQVVPVAPVVAPVAAVAPAAPAAATPSSPAPADDVDDGLSKVASPIIGTFYSAPSPDADDFIKVGDTVNKDSVIGIVEAMKVMNEIKSEIAGVVKKILVSNGTAVEFGQPLVLIDPS